MSGRGIERLCREQVTFIALCRDAAPHFTTVADFISTLGEDLARVFATMLAACDRATRTDSSPLAHIRGN